MSRSDVDAITPHPICAPDHNGAALTDILAKTEYGTFSIQLNALYSGRFIFLLGFLIVHFYTMLLFP